MIDYKKIEGVQELPLAVHERAWPHTKFISYKLHLC